MSSREESPIRKLADFYKSKMEKINAKKQKNDPVKNLGAMNKNLVDFEKISALDLLQMDKSPPTIRPNRKNMKILNNLAMSTFGSEAFQINVDEIDPLLQKQD